MGWAVRFVVALALVLSTTAQTVAQQPGAALRVGMLWGGSATANLQAFEAFRQALRELGWADGKSITFEHRAADGQNERLPGLAAELVRMDVRVIVAVNAPATRAAQQATATIPIVMVGVGDPVAYGLVSNLARPGGNVTGLSFQVTEVIAKQLQLLKEAAPRISRVGVFVNPTNPGAEPFLRGARAGAATLGLTVIAAEVRSVDDFEKAFTAVLRERSDSILVGPEALISSQRQRIAVFAAKNRLPSMYASTLFMDAGGLMAYSANPVDILRHASAHVDKILRGAKAGDLPVEQPTKFELVINLKTAKALGLTLPQSLLIRADRLIE